MKRIFFIISFTLFIFSCSNQRNKIPEHILSEEKMKAVFIDIHFLDVKIEQMKLGPDTAIQVYEVLEDSIWYKHNIKESQFKESHRYYLENTTQLENIYKNLIDSIGIIESLEKSNK